MLDFELINNENIVNNIFISNKDNFSDNLILTNKRLVNIKKEKNKTHLKVISIEEVSEIECNSILPNNQSIIWSITAFATGILLYLAFKETILGTLFFLFLLSLGVYLTIDYLTSKKYQKLIFKTKSNNSNIEYTINKDKAEFDTQYFIKLFFKLRWKLLHENKLNITSPRHKQIFPRSK